MKKQLLYLLLLLLAGCAQQPDPQTIAHSSIAWSEHRQQLSALSQWSLSGKLAVFIGKERKTANIFWQQKNSDYRIELTSFIGTTLLRIEKNKHGVQLTNNDGETFTGEDTENLLKELSPQLSFPVSSLQQWIKGNPIGASYQLNEQQLVSDLLGKDTSDKFWTVNYQRYQDVNGTPLPQKLEMQQGQMRIKISINQWQLKVN